jgi:hypothetical protein
MIRIALSDKGVIAALAELDIDPKQVVGEPWTIGYRPEYVGRRMCQVFLYYEKHLVPVSSLDCSGSIPFILSALLLFHLYPFPLFLY